VTSDELVVEAARAIRPELPEIVPDGWESVDDDLAACLAEEPTTAERVRTILSVRPETASWVVAFLTGEGGVTRGSLSLADGSGELVQAPRFACPNGDYVWYRRTRSRSVPLCRTHQLRLVLRPPL
jgi:hypothetical protein